MTTTNSYNNNSDITIATLVYMSMEIPSGVPLHYHLHDDEDDAAEFESEEQEQ